MIARCYIVLLALCVLLPGCVPGRRIGRSEGLAQIPLVVDFTDALFLFHLSNERGLKHFSSQFSLPANKSRLGTVAHSADAGFD
jgi:hypothetical protein